MLQLRVVPALFFACLYAGGGSLPAQTELVTNSFFPAELEFKELLRVAGDRKLESPDDIRSAADGPLLLEAGCARLDERSYAVSEGPPLRITIAHFRDSMGSYAAYSLLRIGPPVSGLPGDLASEDASRLMLVRGPMWIVIEGGGGNDLRRRIAISVVNRIGRRDFALPIAVDRLPERGLDSSTVRLFLGPLSFREHAEVIAGEALRFESGMQIAQARYSVGGRSGSLSLINFPTAQMAEEFFERLGGTERRGIRSGSVYARKVGLLVGVLGGSFGPAEAGEILGGLRYQYSVRWIYDKNNRQGKTLWGIPVSLLGTVVRSLVLTVLLCISSIFLGAVIAFTRIALKGRTAAGSTELGAESGMIRLNLSDSRPGKEPDSRAGLQGG